MYTVINNSNPPKQLHFRNHKFLKNHIFHLIIKINGTDPLHPQKQTQARNHKFLMNHINQINQKNKVQTIYTTDLKNNSEICKSVVGLPLKTVNFFQDDTLHLIIFFI